jgi:putative N6-adenine-specific DNA methylase
MFVISAPGLEPLVASEIDQLGIRGGSQLEGGVAFSGGLAQLYQANLWLRTASRVVVRMDEFHASSFHELERGAKRVAWEEYLVPGSSVVFRVTCRKSRLYHSDAVAQRLSEAAVQQVPGVKVALLEPESSDENMAEDREGTSVEVRIPPQLFVVRISHDNCVISADSSGGLLHRRGYRQATGKAPLRETLAAAMVIGSEWDGVAPLIDPMCGSGTIAIEAAMIARRMAPGVQREFAFQQWPGFRKAVWESIKERASENVLSGTSGALMASDRDDGAVKLAMENALRAGVANDIEISARPISAIEPPAGSGWMITNPPYGVRVGDPRDLRNLYAQLGKVIRSRMPHYTVAMLTADPVLESMLRLRLQEIFRTRNGGIPVRLMKTSAQ